MTYRRPSDSRRPTAGELVRAREAAGRHVPRMDPRGPMSGPSTRRPSSSRPTRLTRAMTLARITTAIVSCAVVAITGIAWKEAGAAVSGFRVSGALGARPAPHGPGTPQNILLMGLDTRKDLNGRDLPDDILHQLHAGDSSDGGYNTNTLILLHIPATGKPIVAFSIPRDDLVELRGADVPEAKIKEAYGRKKAMVETELVAQGVTDPIELENRGREAGRAETLQTVEELTGVTIDRFAEVSLVGFYDLATALGGVPVCLKHAVRDRYSGARFPAGRQRLSARQSLAFVRQRHGLPNGDLDRTHRQQAFLLSALHELRQRGTLADIGKVNALVAAAQRNIVVSSGWDLTEWIGQMDPGEAQQISFRTLPVVRYSTFDGQDVNIVDPDAIKARVRSAFRDRSPARGRPGGAPQPQSSSAPGTTADTTGPDAGGPVVSATGIPCVN